MIQRLFILTTLAGVFICGNITAREIPVDGYAAMVNDKVITIGDVMEYIRPVEMQLKQTYTGKALQDKLEEAFGKALDALIDEALILADFGSKEMQIPEQLVDERVNSVIHERFNDDRAAFLEALTSQRMTLEEMRQQVKDSLVVMILRRQEVSDQVSISPLAVLELYEKNIDRYREPGQVKLRMIALNKGETEADQVLKMSEAERIIERLQNGEEFAAVAEEVSEDNKAQYGGDWGWIEAQNLRAELAEQAALLKPGEISGVIDLGSTIYIMTIEARKEAAVVPLESVRPQLERELRMQEEAVLYEKWISRLKKKYYVQSFN